LKKADVIAQASRGSIFDCIPNGCFADVYPDGELRAGPRGYECLRTVTARVIQKRPGSIRDMLT
jgi:hypothetical protein